jgi:hypothetical protein
MFFKTLAISVGLCASLLLVPAGAHAQAPAANDPDLKEVVAYRLTVPALNRVVQATKNMAEAVRNDPRFKRQAALEEEIQALEEKDERTEAEEERLEQLRADLEAEEQKSSETDNPKTLSEMAAAIEKEPLAAKALADAGISARDYAKFALAYFQAGMVAGMLKQGLIKEVPPDLAATVNMENVKFVQEHEAELEEFGKAMKATKVPR